jgi:2,5-diketo-D-gluconate reductase B
VIKLRLDHVVLYLLHWASRAESQKANLDALNVTLDDEDRKAIAALPKDRRCVNPGFGPDWD